MEQLIKVKFKVMELTNSYQIAVFKMVLKVHKILSTPLVVKVMWILRLNLVVLLKTLLVKTSWKVRPVMAHLW